MNFRRLLLVAATATAACSPDAIDVCAGYASTCLDLTVTSATVTSIDTLIVTATGAAQGPRTSALGRSAALPVHVAIQLPAGTSGALHLEVVGQLGALPVGHGNVSVTLLANQRSAATVDLIAPGSDSDLPLADLSRADFSGVDLTPAPIDLAPGGDQPPSDLSDPPDLQPFCVALADHACSDGNTLERCNSSGTAYESIACARGCGATPTPHCKLVVPTGAAQNSDITIAGLADKTLNNVTLHSDTGEIEGSVRAANGDPTALTVLSGIGFHVVNVGGVNLGIFLFDQLTLTGTIKIVGTHSVALLARSDVTITNLLDVAANDTANTPGPGGFAGGTSPSALTGLGPGGGSGGTFNSFKGGGGGGGHGGAGGNGATVSTGTGGAGGGAYDTGTLVVLRGGSGGGAVASGSAGGAGGGAVQIVSQTSITVQGGIAAGGAGGRGADTLGGGGGGAGGAILLEAPTVTVSDAGFLVAGGGGGGGTQTKGNAAGNSGPPEVFVGRGGFCGAAYCGGQGAYSATTTGVGANGTVDGQGAGGGGGAGGRVRINSLTGTAALSTTGTLYVPSTSATTLFQQGLITIQ